MRTPPVRLVLAVLVPAEPLLPGAAPAPAGSRVAPPPLGLRPAEVEAIQRFLDPYYDAGLAPSATVWAEMKLNPEGEELRIDIPHRAPDDLVDLLETLYVVHGWPAVDGLCERAQRSLIGAVSSILHVPDDELSALTMLAGRDRPLYVPPEHTDVVAEAIGGLIELAEKRPWPRVIAGLKAVFPTNGLFARKTAEAVTQPDIAANVEVAARLFADVVVALSQARARLRDDVVAALLRTELEARRLLKSTITDSRATICREAIRYFGLHGEESAGNVLNALHAIPVVSAGKSKPQTGQTVRDPEGLQAAMRQLIPSAREVVRIQGAAPPGTPPTPRRMTEAELARKRVTYGHELGRYAQEFPVLSQIAVEDIEDAAGAGPAVLGDYVFPLLRRAYAANRGMSRRFAKFPVILRLPEVRSDRHPERAAARVIADLGPEKTVWGFPKYVQRALGRTAGPSDDFSRRAVGDTLEALDVASGSVGEGLAQAAGEMFVLEMTSHFLPRFLPAFNVMLAAWHITSAISEFGKRTEEFYCSLDPRDALIEAAPSTSGLVFEVATEAAFAVI
jgi:hypothetical protein